MTTGEGKRKRFWIDAPTQLQFVAFIVVLVLAAIVLSYVSTNHGLEEEAFQSDRLFLPLSAAKHALLEPFLISGAISILAACVLGLFWSHRLIGPLMVLTAGLRRVKEGNLKEDLRVRDFDLLSGTVKDFNEMQASLKNNARSCSEQAKSVDEKLSELSGKLRDQAKSPKPLIDEIENIRKDVRKLTSFFSV